MRTATAFRSRRYRVPATPFAVITADGVRVEGHRLGDSAESAEALVFCHGFLGWHRKGRLVRFQEELARAFTVYAFDFRGHGQSGGLCEWGALEHLDVEAVVAQARADGAERVITFGGSMGGIAVIRHAALVGGVDAVVTVSTPAEWDGHRTPPMRRIARLAATPPGRQVLRALGARTARTRQPVESPAEIVGAIAPTPLVIFHGRDDHFFDEEQAWLLYRRAGFPKKILLASRFGHAEDGYTPAFARQVSYVLRAMLGPPSRP